MTYRLARQARHRGHLDIAERFMERAEESQANAEAIREMIVRFNAVPTEALDK